MNRPDGIKKLKGDTLCDNCSHCRRVLYDDWQVEYRCNWVTDELLRRPVLECNSYHFKYSVPPSSMEKSGWVLDLSKGKIGFHRPKFNPSTHEYE